MKSIKHLGIWMDHSVAYQMVITNDTIVTNTIESKPKLHDNEENVMKDESHMLNKEQRLLTAYYKKLSDVIKDYEEVLLFGPTEAKNELLNTLKGNHLFEKIRIEVKSADKMTENQRQAFVKEYFKTSI